MVLTIPDGIDMLQRSPQSRNEHQRFWMEHGDNPEIIVLNCKYSGPTDKVASNRNRLN